LAYDAKMYCRTFVSMVQSLVKLSQTQGWGFTFILREGDSMVARGRSLLASRFLTDPACAHCTDLVFIDGDLFWEGDELEKLMSHDVDVVGGAYPYKNDSGNFPLRWSSQGLMEENGLWIVQAVTPGFLRISRRALNRIVAELPYLKVADSHDSGEMWMFFDNAARQNGVYDEGYVFCEHWRCVGGTVYLEPDLKIQHIGMRAWQAGSIREWMDRKSTEVAKLNHEFPNIPPLRLFQKTNDPNIDLVKEQAEAVEQGAPIYNLHGAGAFLNREIQIEPHNSPGNSQPSAAPGEDNPADTPERTPAGHEAGDPGGSGRQRDSGPAGDDAGASAGDSVNPAAGGLAWGEIRSGAYDSSVGHILTSS
jgi:hypothetical protein